MGKWEEKERNGKKTRDKEKMRKNDVRINTRGRHLDSRGKEERRGFGKTKERIDMRRDIYEGRFESPSHQSSKSGCLTYL